MGGRLAAALPEMPPPPALRTPAELSDCGQEMPGFIGLGQCLPCAGRAEHAQAPGQAAGLMSTLGLFSEAKAQISGPLGPAWPGPPGWGEVVAAAQRHIGRG